MNTFILGLVIIFCVCPTVAGFLVAVHGAIKSENKCPLIVAALCCVVFLSILSNFIL